MAVSLNVTSVDMLDASTDADNDGVADAGETVVTTIQITNNGTTDALGMSISDTLNGLTIDPASVTITPVAVDDAFTITGNTPITLTKAQLLGNDLDPDGNTANLIITDVSAGTNGTIVDNGNGTYTFTPTTGLDVGATATFTYTVQDEDGVQNVSGFEGKVTLTISDVVWYVNNNYDGSNGPSDGSYLRPFTSMSALNGVTGDGSTNDDVDSAGESIFVYHNATANIGAITLEDNQKLLGDGHALNVNGITIGNDGVNSVLTATSGALVTLASGNTISGITLQGTGTAAGIAGTNFGTVTINNSVIDVVRQAISLNNGTVAGSGFTSTDSDGGTSNVSLTGVSGTLNLGGGALSGATGDAFAVSGGSVTTDFNGTITQASNAHTVSVSGGHSGTLVFDGNITATGGEGLVFDNADGSYDFNGVYTANGGTAGVDILNGSGGTFTFDNASNTITHGAAGDAFTVGGTATTANVTWNGNITDSNGNAVYISEHDGGTVTFQNGTIASTGASAGGIDVVNSNGGTINFNSQTTLSTQGNAGVTLTNNGGGTINFAAAGNGLDITTTSGAGFNASGGGTISVTGSGNSVTSGSGAAVIVTNTIIGAGGLNWQSIGATNALTAVSLVNTGTGANGAGSGAFTVTGTGADDSGGTISGTLNAAYYLSGTGALNLTQVNIVNAQNDGIVGTNVNGLTLNSVEIDGIADSGGGSQENTDRGVEITNLTGTATVTGSTFSNFAGHNFNIINSSGTLNLTVTSSTFSGSQVAGVGGDDGLLIEANDTAAIIASITGSTFSNNEGDHFQFATNGTASGASHLTFSGNTLTNSPLSNAELLGGGITISPAGSADLTFTIANNNITGNNMGGAIDITSISSTSQMHLQGTISGNQIGNPAVAESGSAQASGISVENNGNATMTIAVTNNVVTQVDGNFAIDIFSRGGTGAGGNMHVTVRDNTISNPGPNAFQGLVVRGGTSGGTDQGNMYLDIANNSTATSLASDIRVSSNGDVNMFFEDYAGPVGAGGSNTTQIDTYLEVRNPAGGNASVAYNVTDNTATLGTTGNVNMPANPTQPLLAVVTPETQQTPEPGGTPAAPPSPAPDTEDEGARPSPAAPAHPVIVDDGVLSQAELDYFVDAAIERWVRAGATAEQIAAMRAATFDVVDMTGIYLGASTGTNIAIDSDGAGIGWYLDSTPGDDSEFTGTGSRLTGTGEAAGRIDLLTTLMHELGHQIGIEDTYSSGESGALMYGYVNLGERRLPAFTDVAEAGSAPVDSTAFALGPVGAGSLPAGKAIQIRIESVVDGYGPGLVVPLSNTTTVSGSNFSNVTANHSLTRDTLTLGGTVFVDADRDNGFDAGEGTAGVTVQLYVDANGNGVFDEISVIATTTTDANGNYSFGGLAAGNYAVGVGSPNFTVGAPLAGRASLNGGDDPDDDVDGDDNGLTSGLGGFLSGLISLGFNSETATDGTGQLDINNTLDFGFVTPNQAPTSSNFSGDSATFVEDGSAVRLDVGGNATIADTDNVNFANGSLNVMISGNYIPAEDVLGIATTAAVSFTATTVSVNGTQIATYTGGGPGNGSMAFHLNANATSAALTELVRALTYSNSNSTVPSNLNRTVTIILIDGRGTNEGAGTETLTLSTTVAVQRQNDAVSLAAADLTVAGTEDANLVFSAANGNGITVADPDGDAVTVSLTVGSGTLTIAKTANLHLLAGNGTGTVTIAGYPADINAALEGLIYRGNLNFEGSDSLTVSLSDSASNDTEVIAITLADDGRINGSSGDDTLGGTNGADFFLLTQGGTDTVTGGAGDDAFLFGSALTAADNVDGGAGTADQLGLQGTYNLTFGANNLVGIEQLILLAGTDTRFGPATGPHSYDLTTIEANVNPGQTLLVNANALGASEHLTFNGAAEQDGGMFRIYAGLGIDTLTGGSGSDAFYFGEGARFTAADRVNGGNGINDDDQLGLRGEYVGITFNADTMTGVETLVLMSSTDARFPAAGVTYRYDLILDNGNIASGKTLTVQANSLIAGETAVVNGSAESDGNFRFIGGAGNDSFTGGLNGDMLFGGLGADTLAGGSGNDSFVYKTVADSTAASSDSILDFMQGDIIDLSRIDAISGTPGNDGFTFIGGAAFSGAAGELRLEDRGGGVYWLQGDVDGVPGVDFQLTLTVTDGHAILSNDFLL